MLFFIETLVHVYFILQGNGPEVRKAIDLPYNIEQKL